MGLVLVITNSLRAVAIAILVYDPPCSQDLSFSLTWYIHCRMRQSNLLAHLPGKVLDQQLEKRGLLKLFLDALLYSTHDRKRQEKHFQRRGMLRNLGLLHQGSTFVRAFKSTIRTRAFLVHLYFLLPMLDASSLGWSKKVRAWTNTGQIRRPQHSAFGYF